VCPGNRRHGTRDHNPGRREVAERSLPNGCPITKCSGKYVGRVRVRASGWLSFALPRHNPLLPQPESIDLPVPSRDVDFATSNDGLAEMSKAVDQFLARI
jgi:hypothetical protein